MKNEKFYSASFFNYKFSGGGGDNDGMQQVEDPETGEALHPLRKDFPLTGIPGSLPLPAYPEKFGDVIED